MSGFIDPNAPEKVRLERLEALISEALPLLGVEAFSPEAQEILRDLYGENEVRRERARRVTQRAIEADPLPSEDGTLLPEVCTDPDCTIRRRPGRPMHGPHSLRASAPRRPEGGDQ